MKPPLQRIQVNHFKALQASPAIPLTPLTTLIGSNGSGKSSLLEALETFQAIVLQGLHEAMVPWRGFEHIWNKAVPHTYQAKLSAQTARRSQSEPMALAVTLCLQQQNYKAKLVINLSDTGDELFIQEEQATVGKFKIRRDAHGHLTPIANGLQTIPDDESLLSRVIEFAPLKEFVRQWQFVRLHPAAMKSPRPQNRTGGEVRLLSDGANLAEYLLHLRERDPLAFEGIVDTLRGVLGYAKDLQPALTSELERAVYLQLTEGTFKIPGWVLSTGTLRLLGLLALLRHPTPPPVILIEEIENGLDPRTIQILIDEIQYIVRSGISQVIITTHSPYLLDLIPLPYVVFVERIDDQPIFTRPNDQEALQTWKNRFGTGKLYTMGRFSQKE